MALSFDAIKNLAKVTVSTGYGASDTSIALVAGQGARLPTPPFNATWWNATDYADPADDPNVELVRVTNVVTDTLTITRAQEGTVASTKNTATKTYLMIAGLTVLMMGSVTGALLSHDAGIQQSLYLASQGTNGANFAIFLAGQGTNGANQILPIATAGTTVANLDAAWIGTLNTQVGLLTTWVGTIDTDLVSPVDSSARAGVGQVEQIANSGTSGANFGIYLASQGTGGVNQVLPIAVAGTTVANLDAAWIGTLTSNLTAGVNQSIFLASQGTNGVNQILPIAVAGTTVANLDAIWIGTLNTLVTQGSNLAYEALTIAQEGTIYTAGSHTDSWPITTIGTWNDEFTGNTLAPKWTVVNAPTLIEANSLLVMSTGSVGPQVYKGVTQLRPAAPFEFQCKMGMTCNQALNAAPVSGVGLIARDSASHKIVAELLYNVVTVVSGVSVPTYNIAAIASNGTVGGYVSNQTPTITILPEAGGFYLRFKDDAVNFNWWWSNDGVGWQFIGSTSRTAFLTNAYDSVGIVIYADGTNSMGNCDWFRRTV